MTQNKLEIHNSLYEYRFQLTCCKSNTDLIKLT